MSTLEFHIEGVHPGREQAEQQKVNSLHRRAAEQIRSGIPASQIQADLVATGLPHDTAQLIVTETVRVLNEKKEQAHKYILWGSVLSFGAAIVIAGYYIRRGTGVPFAILLPGGYLLGQKGFPGLYAAVGWKGSMKTILLLGGLDVVTLSALVVIALNHIS
ncbi:MAG: hypothetical protein EXR53_04720 [Dehalococcoidia bacterium]|nr:hypothetical protein [Dehalococcoidia bacterium]